MTSPASYASCAVSGSASRAIRIARARPIEAATVAVAPPSGISPIRAKASRNDADSVATMMSAARAAEQPTPAATPLTAATTGLSRFTIARMIRLARSRAVTSKCSWALAPEMSAPVLNAGAGAGHRHHAYVVARGRLLDEPGQVVGHLAGERVEHLGPVQGQPEGAVLDPDLEVSQRRPRPAPSPPAPSGGARLGDAGAQVRQQAYAEARLDGVERGAADAVVGGDAAHVDVGHLVPAQPVGQADVARGRALEAGVRRGVLALEEDRVERLRVEVRVERLAVGADLAVHRPGVLEVGVVRPVRAGVDVVVLGGDDVRVVGRLRVLDHPVVQHLGDVGGDPGAAGDRQRAALAEVVLHVDHDQRPLHVGERIDCQRAGSQSMTSWMTASQSPHSCSPGRKSVVTSRPPRWPRRRTAR